MHTDHPVTWRMSALSRAIVCILILAAALMVPATAQRTVPCDVFINHGGGVWTATRQTTVNGDLGSYTVLPGQMAGPDVTSRLETQCR